MLSRFFISCCLMLAMALLVVVGHTLLKRELGHMHDQRFLTLSGELREQIETDLHIGFELADAHRTQSLLENAAARTPSVLSLEVVSADGVSLFSSDRGLRGLATPSSWLSAARHSPDNWRVERQDEYSLGLPLRDAMGQTVGQLVLTYRNAVPVNTSASTWWPGALLSLAVGVGAWLLLGLRERAHLRAQHVELQHLQQALQGDALPHSAPELLAAARQIQAARHTLDEVDQRTHQLAEGAG